MAEGIGGKRELPSTAILYEDAKLIHVGGALMISSYLLNFLLWGLGFNMNFGRDTVIKP
jgi:hypothetical protein